jgi:hypothetical protein
MTAVLDCLPLVAEREAVALESMGLSKLPISVADVLADTAVAA